MDEQQQLESLGPTHPCSQAPQDTHSYETLQHRGYGSGQTGLRGRAEALEESGRARLRPDDGGPSTFDGDAFAGPLLLKGGEAFLLADADDVLLEVKFFGVEAQQAEPQLPHRLRVWLQLREDPVLPRQNNLRAAVSQSGNNPQHPCNCFHLQP